MRHVLRARPVSAGRTLACIGLLCAAPAFAQTSEDVFRALEGVYPDQLGAAHATTSEPGVWNYTLSGTSTAQLVGAKSLRDAGHVKLDLSGGSDWSKLRKALTTALGKADTRRGNQVLVWPVTDADSRFASTSYVVLSKSGPDSTFSFERRKAASDSRARVTDRSPRSRSRTSNLSALPNQSLSLPSSTLSGTSNVY